MMAATFTNIDEYIAQFDASKQRLLQELRELIRQAAPEATETISYQMPTFRYHGNLIHFALFKNHLGIYPGSGAIGAFEDALKDYKTSKGAVQIPFDKKLPKKVIQGLVKFNLDQLRDKTAPDWKRYNNQWKEAAEKVQQVINELPLVKEFKWGGDVYTYNKKNVVAYSGFKNHFAIWFYNGVFLEDRDKVLLTASEGKTKALRQWRFTSAEEIDPKKLKAYIEEAIQTVIDGKEIKTGKTAPKKVEGILKQAFDKDKNLKAAFDKLTPGKQKEYIVHIEEAKQEKTKLARLEKITPMILGGKGLHDKYKR